MSSNDVQHCNFPLACYIFSYRIIFLFAAALPQRLPLVPLSFHILPHTVQNYPFSRPSYPPTQHHAISKMPRPSPPLSPPPTQDHATTHPTHPLTYKPVRLILPEAYLDRPPKPHARSANVQHFPSPSPYSPEEPPSLPLPCRPRATTPITQPYHFQDRSE